MRIFLGNSQKVQNNTVFGISMHTIVPNSSAKIGVKLLVPTEVEKPFIDMGCQENLKTIVDAAVDTLKASYEKYKNLKEHIFVVTRQGENALVLNTKKTSRLTLIKDNTLTPIATTRIRYGGTLEEADNFAKSIELAMSQEAKMCPTRT